MTIGIDANWAIYEKAGIGKYSYNLIKKILEVDNKNCYVLYFNFFKKPRERMKIIRDLTKDAIAPYEVKVSPIPAAWREFLFQTPFPAQYLYKEKIDVYFSPFFGGIPKKGFEKMVVTIHDLVFLKFPEHRGAKLSNYYLKRTKNSVEKCQKIIAVSEATKKDLVEYLKVPSEKIEVIHEAVNPEFSSVTDSRKTRRVIRKYLKSDNKYILSVCTLEPRKNLPRLIKAYALLPNQMRKDYKLVLAGGSGWNNSEVYKTVSNLNLTENVVFAGFVEDEDLPYLYKGAAVFVYPALYEGFGLPPLEAISSGTPVITSNTSSLPEVLGKSAVLVNPLKEEEISSAIRKVLTSPKLVLKLKKLGLSQVKKYNWEKTAKKTIKMFESLKKKV